MCQYILHCKSFVVFLQLMVLQMVPSCGLIWADITAISDPKVNWSDMFSEVALIIGGETTIFTLVNYPLMSWSLVNGEISLEVRDKATFITFKFNFFMNWLNMLCEVYFLLELLLASLTLKLYSFMKSLFMDSKMVQSGEGFSTNITGMFYLHMDSFNVSLHVFLWSLKLALFTLNFGFFMQELNVVS